MVYKLELITSISNFIVGCLAGTILVSITGNYLYFIINLVTGFASGFLLVDALSEKNDGE